MHITGSGVCPRDNRSDSIPAGCGVGTCHAVPLRRNKDALVSDHLSGVVALGLSNHDTFYTRQSMDIVGTCFSGTVVLRSGT